MAETPLDLLHCLVCKKSVERADFRAHIDAHDVEERPVRCNGIGCSETFTTQGDANEHARLNHTAMVPCPVCGKHFFPNAMPAHVSGHGDERPYACRTAGCGVFLKTEHDRQRHERTHEESSQGYLCPSLDCSPPFFNNSRAQLGRHFFRVHATFASAVCNVNDCGASFTSIEQLRSHSRAHIIQDKDKKDYLCRSNGCKKRMRLATYIVSHILKEHCDQRITCAICQEPCGTEEAMGKHLQKQHAVRAKETKQPDGKAVYEILDTNMAGIPKGKMIEVKTQKAQRKKPTGGKAKGKKATFKKSRAAGLANQQPNRELGAASLNITPLDPNALQTPDAHAQPPADELEAAPNLTNLARFQQLRETLPQRASLRIPGKRPLSITDTLPRLREPKSYELVCRNGALAEPQDDGSNANSQYGYTFAFSRDADDLTEGVIEHNISAFLSKTRDHGKSFGAIFADETVSISQRLLKHFL